MQCPIGQSINVHLVRRIRMKHSILLFIVFVSISWQQLTGQTKLDKAFREVVGSEESVIPSNSVMNKSFVIPNGEKVLRFQIVLDTSLQTVWNAFTDEREITTWEVAQVRLDLRMGGSMQTHYKKSATIGEPGTITLGIINYLPMELLTYKVTLTDAFPEKCRNEDDNLQEVVQFRELAKNKTMITSSMIGWGKGKEWDDVYKKFEMGNGWTYEQLIKRYRSGPIEWK